MYLAMTSAGAVALTITVDPDNGTAGSILDNTITYTPADDFCGYGCFYL